jgi:hypothetical protein
MAIWIPLERPPSWPVSCLDVLWFE